MTLPELATALRLFTPALRRVAGCVVLTLGDEEPPDEGQMARFLSGARWDARRAERDLNRKFLVADVLDALDLGDAARGAPGVLVALAELLAARVRDCAARAFPGEALVVEVIGARLAEEEPLEVCVTVHRA